MSQQTITLQEDPPWFVLVQACIESNHTATPIEVKPGEGDSKLAPWVFLCRATEKPTSVRRGKNGEHTPESVYWGCLVCFLQSINTNYDPEVLKQLLGLDKEMKQRRKIECLKMVDKCTKNKLYVFPPRGGNSNWSQHFAVQHKGLKKVIVGDKKTGSETEQLKNTLAELENRGKEVLKKFFMLKASLFEEEENDSRKGKRQEVFSVGTVQGSALACYFCQTKHSGRRQIL